MFVRGHFNALQLVRIANELGIKMDLKKAKSDKKGRKVIKFRLLPIGNKFRRLTTHGKPLDAVCNHGYKAFLEKVKSLDEENFEYKSTTTKNKWKKEIVYDIQYKNNDIRLNSIKYGEICTCNNSLKE